MNNRDKTYAKALLALAIGFSFAAEVANHASSENRSLTENQEVQERVNTSKHQDKISFWE